MQFKYSQTIDASAEYVFARITDFKKFETQKGPKGFSFKRQGKLPVRIGTRWDISIPVRGRARRFSAELSQYIPPRILSYKSTSNRYEGVLSITIKPRDAARCEINIQVVAKPHGLPRAWSLTRSGWRANALTAAPQANWKNTPRGSPRILRRRPS